MVAGWKLYRTEGLKQLPRVLANAMEDYKHECDVLEQFRLEKCLPMEGKRLPLSSITKAFNEWAVVNGVGRSNSRRLAEELRKSGFEMSRSHGKSCVEGFVLIDNESDSLL